MLLAKFHAKPLLDPIQDLGPVVISIVQCGNWDVKSDPAHAQGYIVG